MESEKTPRFREITDTEMKKILTVRIEYPKFYLRVIVAHAPQETAKIEEKSEFFEELMVQVERGDSSGDQVVLLGDFNALLVSDLESIDAEASPNGKLLADVIKKYQM